ncbi:SRPBCC family protein [Arsenicitalea aurantiaca]|uniref:SRPBCC family protein n=1 Tax=Arsenicitalea aurantiaca TaxID=1783274 RepID=A0A433X3B5_9HYPH|nr:SRPBCC family protein [Arsenicitalea aurantiaca]RUT28552.1 SRPBCC family protein [Arsenicitalea aurantiaca]
MDVGAIIGAVTRTVATRTRDGKSMRVVIAERDYETDIEDLWNAVTDPDRIARWFMPIEGSVGLGERYQLKGNAGGEVLACDPPKEFSVTWEFGGEVSWLTVSLSPAGEVTRLRLEHSAHVPEEFWSQYGAGATGVGWDMALMGLGMHIKTGTATVWSPEEINAWSASADGRSFIVRSAEGWVAAAIADGDDADAARAAGERTKAFYTGDTPPAG